MYEKSLNSLNLYYIAHNLCAPLLCDLTHFQFLAMQLTFF